MVTYYTTPLGAFSLVALYRLAHFCIVSSLHDGMNLIVAGRNVFNWASDILEGLESIWTKPLLYSVRGWEDTSV